MYEAFVIEAPNRKADGMIHVVVEFRGEGLETVTRRTFTDSFTEDWFKQWVAQQLNNLNKPQELAEVSEGKIDVTGINVEPAIPEELVVFQNNVRLIGKMNWIRDNFDPSIVNHKQYIDCVNALVKSKYDAGHLDSIPLR